MIQIKNILKRRSLLAMIIVMFFSGSISSQCVNPTWSAAKHWSTYTVGELYEEGGKDYEVHTPSWCQSYSPSSAWGHLGFTLSADPCDNGATAPVMTLIGSSVVTCTTADFTANISDIGGADVTTRGFIYGTTEAHVNSSTEGTLVGSSLTIEETGTYGIGSFTLSVTGLTSSATHYFRAYSTNASGTTYAASTKNFFTCAVIPTLTTTAISALSCETANSGGNTSSDGGDPVTVRGVCWSTSSGPTTGGSFTSDGSGTGAFASAITGMTDGITYYLRAYATNGIGTGYGNEISFTTASGCTPVYYSCTACNSWSLLADCSTSDGPPGSTDFAILRDDWFNSVQAYSLANLAHGQDGGVFFSAKPLKLTIQSGGRAVFTSSSYTGLPAGFSLVVDLGGVFSSHTSLQVVSSIVNNGAVHLNGAVTNGNNITGTGDICYRGNFENSTLGGSLNGAFVSATQATLDGSFFTTTDAALGGDCGDLGNVLPIELISFTVNEVYGDINISWATGSEINSGYFQVLKSSDGVNWSVINVQNGTGNSSFITNYNFIDKNKGNETTIYYRLRHFDLDGSSTYSVVKVMELLQEGGIKAIFDDGISINVVFESTNSEEIIVSVLGVDGRLVALSTKIVLTDDQKLIKLDKGNMLSGIYFVKIETQGLIFAEKFMVRRL
jgi:hypothetical protein